MNMEILNSLLIEQFRNCVNSNGVYTRYRDVNGKDEWSRICSAMDWITVAVEYINSGWQSKNKGLLLSAGMFTYIACIDMIWDAVKQLKFVFFPSKSDALNADERFHFEKRGYGENENETDAVLKKLFDYLDSLDDNRYFKELRAMFGAHPTKLEPLGRGKGDFYAGWSSNIFGNGNYSIALYSDIPSVPATTIKAHIDELNSFAQSRYSYLEELILTIQRQYIIDIDKLKSTPIEKCSDILAQLKILKSESQRRFDLFADKIDEIIKALTLMQDTEMNQNLLSRYRDALVKETEGIINGLQNMDFESDDWFDSSYYSKIPSSVSYAYSKLTEPDRIDAYEEVYEYLLGNEFELNEKMTGNELALLIEAGAYLGQFEDK